MKLLVDGLGRAHTYLRMSVTDQCNLRCAYCLPAEDVPRRPRDEILRLEELLRLAAVFVAMGIRKIRLTGGEPMVRNNVEWLVEKLAKLPGVRTLAMTTNGVLLAAMAPMLKAIGLHAVNVSLDTLRRDRFVQITGADRLADVLAGMDAALAAGFVPLKLNTVVVPGLNDDELQDFVELCRERPLNVRFIEHMPFAGNGWADAGYTSCQRMREAIETRYRLLPASPDGSSAVARDYRIVGFSGTVSFVSPLSADYCAACTRLRLTADGAVKSCLFHPAEVNVRAALRAGASDEELAEMIRAAVLLKPERHPPVDDLLRLDNRSMVQIGG